MLIESEVKWIATKDDTVEGIGVIRRIVVKTTEETKIDMLGMTRDPEAVSGVSHGKNQWHSTLKSSWVQETEVCLHHSDCVFERYPSQYGKDTFYVYLDFTIHYELCHLYRVPACT